jgi:hypothetical protein
MLFVFGPEDLVREKDTHLVEVAAAIKGMKTLF